MAELTDTDGDDDDDEDEDDEMLKCPWYETEIGKERLRD